MFRYPLNKKINFSYTEMLDDTENQCQWSHNRETAFYKKLSLGTTFACKSKL